MDQSLAGLNATVTGGAVGIGRSIAIALAGAGARVTITHRTHAPDVDMLREIESGSGRPLLALPVDATDSVAVDAALSAIAAETGSIDILVNNVGGLVQRSPIAEMDVDLWRRVLAVNLDSMFFATRAVLAHMPSGAGRIINVASLAARNGGHAGATAYAATKAGVLGFTRGLAKEVAPRGITVNALAPGFIEDTPFHDTFTTAASKETTISGIPAGRAGTPDDVAGAAVWLAGPTASYVNGAVIDINGAQYFG